MSTYAELRSAEDRGLRLFDECIARGLVVAGKRERTLNEEVFALAEEMFGVRRYWHKRIVRAGKNTLLPYAENPPDLVIAQDDIVFFDFGPVFGDWEADVGRTYVLGEDRRKHALAADVTAAWQEGAEYYLANPDITAGALYTYVQKLASARGWEFGHTHCGHLIGRFPHEQIEGDDETRYLRAANESKLAQRGADGELLHWILEIHFVDRAAEFGAFYEGILPPR